MPARSAPRAPVAGVIPRRLSFQFSADGERGACLVADGSPRPLVEAWSLTGPRPVSRILPSDELPLEGTQLVPCADGRVLGIHSGPTGRRLGVLSSYGEQPVGAPPGEALRGLVSRDPSVLAWLLLCHGGERTTLYAVESISLARRAVSCFEGRVTGPVWWDASGRTLTATVIAGGERRVLRVDTASGMTARTDLSVAPLAVSPFGKVLGTARGPHGTVVGWLDPDGSRLRCPPALEGSTGSLRPLAFDPTGTMLAFRLTEGATSRLLVGEVGSDEVADVELPPGVIRAAGWGRRGLHLVYTTPASPAVLATINEQGHALAPALPGGAAAEARLECFDGPAGSIEAVCYGDRRSAGVVVLALHGGPEAAWEFAWDPVLRACSAAGIAVVAPNQRGSVGYGTAHRRAIDGSWGGPDLADVLYLRRTLAADRGGAPPALFGTSYGAFLALLAAAAEPDGWSRCAAVAPFLSAERLYADASSAVRSMIDRLRGRAEPTDDLGPRDLDRLAAHIAAPVFCIHGARDDVIPVAHSRRLVERLRTAGRLRPDEVHYRESAEGGHDPLNGPGGAALTTELVAFLLNGAP
ncbi:alpha/beta fold hydrolase [Phytomonospora sp. NPDC050363]|uniref:alpha/beta hydrolase family protein n=1 Tax=Phytomonospora sp. NPDC050363 TaxID=3155642 RepID=UPI0033C03879